MKKTILSFASLCFATMILMGSGCPLIPSIEEKIVELAVGSSLTLQFEARGSINNKGQTEVFALDDEIDLQQIVEDAGVDIGDVISIAFAGIAYRVTVADPDPSRRITQSTVTLSRDGGPQDVVLVQGFDEEAGVTYDFRTLELAGPQGAQVINAMLDDLLREAQGQAPQGALSGSATWTGTSTPIDESTNFDWEIRLDITIVGTVTLDLPE